MGKTTHDEINIDLDGTIDAAIRRLQELRKAYPKGRISLENEYEYGESYARLKLHFTRNKEPVELEYDRWREKLSRYGALLTASRAYAAEGDEYPRKAEIAALKEELGAWAESRMGSLMIFEDEVLMNDFDGARRRDGTWVLRSLMHSDFMRARDRSPKGEDADAASSSDESPVPEGNAPRP